MIDAGIIAIIEFGSTARDDSDQYSDKDIFAVVEDTDADRFDQLREIVAGEYKTTPTSVACYSASSFDQMIVHGSLFTWHLRLEGRILSDPDGVVEEAFRGLAPYVAFGVDLARFREIYSDVTDAYGNCKILDTFEKHVLFVVARNVCMLLTTWREQPTFGRRTVIPTARRLYPELPLSDHVEREISAGHLAYMRNFTIESDPLVVVTPSRIIQEVGALLDFAAGALH